MRDSRRSASGLSLRAWSVVLLLGGLGISQAWQCNENMPASPVAGMLAMTADAAQNSSMPAVVAAVHSARAGDGAGAATDDTMPPGLAGTCITVLACVAAALLLVFEPRLIALLRRPRPALTAIDNELSAARPSLTRLCVSRT